MICLYEICAEEIISNVSWNSKLLLMVRQNEASDASEVVNTNNPNSYMKTKKFN